MIDPGITQNKDFFNIFLPNQILMIFDLEHEDARTAELQNHQLWQKYLLRLRVDSECPEPLLLLTK